MRFYKTIGLNIFFISYLIVSPLFAVKYNEIKEEEPLLFLFVIKEYNTGNSIVAFINQDTNKLYLPLLDLAQELDFPIEAKSQSLLEGYFVDRNNTFKLDLNEGVIISSGNKINIDISDILVDYDKIYLSTDIIEKAMSLEIRLDMSNLVMQIDSKMILPIEVAAAREKNKNSIQGHRFKYIDYKVEDSLFSAPTLDFKTYTEKNLGSEKQNASGYTLNFGANVMSMDTDFYFQQSNTNDSKRLTFSRDFTKDNLLGITYVSFADTQTFNIPLIKSATQGRGLYISSLSDTRYSQQRTIIIEGPLAEGWQVELYYNDVLIDFKDQNIRGQYIFSNVPIITGNNRFKLKFYGPYGEVREEIKNIVIGANPVEEGEFAFSFSATQDGKSVLDSDNSEGSKFINTSFDGNYGITDNFSLYTGFTTQENSESFDNSKISLMAAGATYTIFNLSFQYTGAFSSDNDNRADKYAFYINNFLGSFYVAHTNYNSIHSQASLEGDSYVATANEARYSANISFFKVQAPIFVSYEEKILEKDKDEKNNKQQKLSLRSYQNFFGIPIFIENEYRKNYKSEYDDITISTNKGINNGLVKLQVKQGILPDNYFKGYQISVDRRFPSLKLALSLSYAKTYNLNSPATDAYKAGIGYITPLGRFSISGTTDGNKNNAISLDYFISLGYNKSLKRIYTEEESNLSRQGNLLVNVFVDNNDNGIFDEGDIPIEGAKLKYMQNKSDENGVIKYVGQQAYKPITIEIDELSVPDITLSTTIKSFDLILRPGITQTVNVPFVRVGDIEGKISTKINGKTIVLANTPVTIFNYEDKIVYRVITDSEGLFIIERLPYGNYYYIVGDQTLEKPVKLEVFSLKEEIMSLNIILNEQSFNEIKKNNKK
jgi:hypothetical protein